MFELVTPVISYSIKKELTHLRNDVENYVKFKF